MRTWKWKKDWLATSLGRLRTRSFSRASMDANLAASEPAKGCHDPSNSRCCLEVPAVSW